MSSPRAARSPRCGPRTARRGRSRPAGPAGAGGDGGGGVGRAVVDDDDLEVRVVEGAGVAEALVERGGRVVGADHHADRRPRRSVEVGDRRAVPPAGDVERRAGRPVGPGQPEVPALDGGVAHPPLVGPGEDAGAGDAPLERRLQLPVEDLGLAPPRLRPVGAGVEADLAEHQRPVAGEVCRRVR